MPAWLTPGAATSSRVDVNDLTVFGQKNVGRQGFVSIAGTVAKARLASPTEFPALADRWSSKTVAVGGGIGAFGASIVGHVVDTPGQPHWEGLGLGLTWRTPVERPADGRCRQRGHPRQEPVLDQLPTRPTTRAPCPTSGTSRTSEA